MPTFPTVAWLQGKYRTVGSILSKTAVECGMQSNADPVAASGTDQFWAQLVVQAEVNGQDLLRKHNWQTFKRLYTFTTTGGSGPDPVPYALPDDFFKLIDQTGWNRTSRFPMAGPISDQYSEFLASWTGGQFYIYLGFKLFGDTFDVFPATAPAGQQVAYEYISRNWIQPVSTNDPAVRTNVITSSSDLILFEPILFTRALKLRVRADRGFDTTAADADFKASWDSVVGADIGGQTCNLSGGGQGIPLLDPRFNIPPSGFGS